MWSLLEKNKKWRCCWKPKSGRMTYGWKDDNLARRRKPQLKNTSRTTLLLKVTQENVSGKKWWVPGKERDPEPRARKWFTQTRSVWDSQQLARAHAPGRSRGFADSLWRHGVTWLVVGSKWKREKHPTWGINSLCTENCPHPPIHH